jgi:hypothetical protein
MQLAQLQQAMQDRILRGTPGIEIEVAEAGQLDVHARLGVYENAFISRLVEALAVTYPALRDSIGDSAFATLTCAFVARSPPSHFSVRYFGADLASFVAKHYLGVKAQVLTDLARWEWSLGDVFDAVDATPMTIEDLASIEPGEWAAMRFVFSPALCTLSVQSNAVQWWRASTQDGVRPARWRTAKPVTWALWRSDLKTYFRSLKTEEAWALDAMNDGHSFGFLCDGLAQRPDEADASTRAATMLHRWLSDSWIIRIH